jgi:hypothetical protein
MPLDRGPIYEETLMGRFPVEPWNTASNIIFLFIVIYYGWKIWQHREDHKFLLFALPVLLVGFIGGTLYHATRSSSIWLAMDVMPIMILSIAATIRFYYLLGWRWYVSIPVFFAPIGLIALLIQTVSLPSFVFAMMGYSSLALTILLPVFLYLRKQSWRDAQWVLLALLAFAMAISFRSADKLPVFDMLYMGSHWLWHAFGGLATFFLVTYIYRDDRRRASRMKLVKS